MKARLLLCLSVTASLFVGSGLSAAATATAATPPPARFSPGLLIRPYASSSATVTQALNVAHANGVQAITAPVRWSDVAGYSAPGPMRWGPLDQMLTSAGGLGMKVSLQVFGTPAWVHPEVTGPGDLSWYPPSSAAELTSWSQFISATVHRYGTRLSAYQIWNEPNAATFWLPAPSPVGYATLLRSSYLAAKAANPNVVVEFGGLSGNDAGYLSAFYKAASATFTDSQSNHWFFDRLNVHPYTANNLPDVRNPQDTVVGAFGSVDRDFQGFALLRSAMAQAGDSAKHLRIGEYGASTAPTWMPAVTDQYRALMLKRSLTLAAASGYVDELDWYAYYPNGVDTAEWDIVGPQFQASPTMVALKQWASGTGPAVNVVVPATATGVVSIGTTLGGAPPVGADLYVDGRWVATGLGRLLSWDSRTSTPGTHAVLVVAKSIDGSVWPSAVQQVTVVNPTPTIVLASLIVPPVGTLHGQVVPVVATLTSDVVGVVPALVVAVRDASGAAYDFPMLQNVAVAPTGTTITFTGSFPAAGPFQVWLAEYTGSAWTSLTTPSTVNIV